jgi:hypothetical protein
MFGLLIPVVSTYFLSCVCCLFGPTIRHRYAITKPTLPLVDPSNPALGSPVSTIEVVAAVALYVFASWSFSESVYLFSQISDCIDSQSTLVLQTVLVMKIIASLVSHTLGGSHIQTLKRP